MDKLKHIGTVGVKGNIVCSLCGKEEPEMALKRGEMIDAYHWNCFNAYMRQYEEELKEDNQNEKTTS